MDHSNLDTAPVNDCEKSQVIDENNQNVEQKQYYINWPCVPSSNSNDYKIVTQCCVCKQPATREHNKANPRHFRYRTFSSKPKQPTPAAVALAPEAPKSKTTKTNRRRNSRPTKDSGLVEQPQTAE